jgi:hypothetical protein
MGHYFTQTLTTLSLWNNEFNDDGAKYLANALLQNNVTSHIRFTFLVLTLTYYFTQTLTTLNLGSNQISSQGAEHIAHALLQNKVI